MKSSSLPICIVSKICKCAYFAWILKMKQFFASVFSTQHPEEPWLIDRNCTKIWRSFDQSFNVLKNFYYHCCCITECSVKYCSAVVNATTLHLFLSTVKIIKWEEKQIFIYQFLLKYFDYSMRLRQVTYLDINEVLFNNSIYLKGQCWLRPNICRNYNYSHSISKPAELNK